MIGQVGQIGRLSDVVLKSYKISGSEDSFFISGSAKR